MLYYGVGKYNSFNSCNGFWGKGAIDAISERLQKELPGLRGFSARSLRKMRTFYEEWAMLDAQAVVENQQVLEDASAKSNNGENNLAPATAKSLEVFNLAVATAKLPDGSF